ncbi:glycoside hydrolase family 36 protein [Allomuricauda sp. d1]|uniref:glycoside hydrolase family 36 protein n=1 Tax=Allomuricauda sp. d1 TaxID=3136725 RepID=UPI0031D3EAAA
MGAIGKVLNSAYSDVIKVKRNENSVDFHLGVVSEDDNVSIYRFEIQNGEEFVPKPIVLEWKIPAVNIKGVWKPTADFSKRIEADWELTNFESRISIDAPVLCLFGNSDENVLCFSCSNPVNRIELSAKYREEDGFFYCQIILFTECKYSIKNFSIDIRLDYRKIHFSEALRGTSKWWEDSENLKPMAVPDIAKKPLYSTWYQFHQDLEEGLLLAECRLAKSMGFESIIIDDGWQTKDNNRGYDFTGDWHPEHFADFGSLVAEIQNMGMKVGIWYSVPFCGVKSNAYQKFRGKFLTENHRWAPVFDPRYPEVRHYLVQTYVNAVKKWNLDGLKLDFIDDFKSYPDTSFDIEGKDLLSINEAVDILLGEIKHELQKIKPDIFIEFRQKYTGPAIRKYGNMLRAFDCPGDHVMNRVRITDIKMLSGNTAVHADMVTWNFDETVEVAALHYMNTLFGVPQISVMLTEVPTDHLRMVEFYTQYWLQNASTLLSSDFLPKAPLENYPLLCAKSGTKSILGLFADNYVFLDKPEHQIDVLNAKLSEDVVVLCQKDFGQYHYGVFDCKGNRIEQDSLRLQKGCNLIKVPASGLLQLKKATGT